MQLIAGAALLKDPGPAGRELVRQYTERASVDPAFVAKYFGPEESSDRKILYEDPIFTSAFSHTSIEERAPARRMTTDRAGQSTVKSPASLK